jgi:uncharacterized protein YigA (DUF484 family)
MDDQTARAEVEMERQREHIESLEYRLEKSTQRADRHMDLVSLGMEVMERRQKRIQELEAKEEYLESLLVSANREINQQRKRIYELEDKPASADRTYLYWRGEALMLEKRLLELMENASRNRGEIERLNGILLKALETLLPEE